MISVVLLACLWLGMFSEPILVQEQCNVTQVDPLIVNSSSTTVVFTPCGSTTLPFWKQREQRNEDTNVETASTEVIELSPWQSNSTSNEKYRRFRLKNNLGHEVELLSYGATVNSIKVPDLSGRLSDIVLGYQDIDSYLKHCR